MDEMEPGRTDRGAERHVLAALLEYPEVLNEIRGIVAANDFAEVRHQVLFTTITGLADEGRPVDKHAIMSALVDSGDVRIVDGAYMAGLMSELPLVANAGHHARRVAEMAAWRRLREYALRVNQFATDPGYDLGVALDKATDLLAAVEQHRPLAGPLSMTEFITRGFDAIERAGDPATARGLRIGLPDLDAMIGGLKPGSLTVFGARPGNGKTVLAMQTVMTNAFQARVPTLWHSLEMSAEEIYMRLASAHSGIPLKTITRGKLSDDDWSVLARQAGEQGNAPLWLDEERNLSLADIRATARRHKHRHGLELLVIDYLQLVTVSRAESRQVAVAELSRGLKLLAGELDIAIVVCAQLNRGSEQRSDKTPTLADLRESGAIEQDADTVVLVHRPEVVDPKTVRIGEADLIVAKNRAGETGLIRAAAQFDRARFVSLAA